MKKVLLILILTAKFSGINAQTTIDSTQKKINYLLESNIAMQKNIQNIQLNLLQCQRIYKAGACITAIGAGITALGIVYDNKTPLFPGPAVTVIGLGTILYSRSYIRKAGVSITGNGLTAKYNF